MTGDENQEQNLAVDARLDEIAAHPAVEAEIDEGSEGPDLFFLDEAADHAGGQAESDIEGQREILVMQDGRDRQNGAAEHGPAGADQQAEKNDGLKRDVGGEKVRHPEPQPNAERERHQEKRQQGERLRGAALFGKEQPPEGGDARQDAGHRGHHAQLDQQRDRMSWRPPHHCIAPRGAKARNAATA